MADYCTAANLKLELGIGDTTDDTQIATAITAASRQIDGYCGRKFSQDGTVVVREFYADSPSFVDLLEQPGEGPAAEISTATGLIVKTDPADSGAFGTTLTIDTDFLLWPRNADDDVRPWTGLLAVGSGSFPILSSGRAGVQVTAKFGWATVPTDVTKACLIQAAQLFSAKDAVFGAVALGDSQAMYLRNTLNASAKALLAPFQRSVLG